MDQLTQLSSYTEVVADTGEIELLKKYTPLDATTNPSLILKALQKSKYQSLLAKAVKDAKTRGGSKSDILAFALKKTAVFFGVEILNLIKGRVSTEIDARLSFDTQGSIAQAKQIINLYEQDGVAKDRVLIKIAATWEGLQAALQLEKEGIRCNITLLFTFCQAVVAAQARSYLISPFVGRILDWYQRQQPNADFNGSKDPGVQFVSKIYYYYKKYNIKTIVMGASFRNTEQIRQLTGCDKLTISPELLQELATQTTPLVRKLKSLPTNSREVCCFTENDFRLALNNDAMATEKLAEGIRKFSEDTQKLEQLICKRL